MKRFLISFLAGFIFVYICYGDFVPEFPSLTNENGVATADEVIPGVADNVRQYVQQLLPAGQDAQPKEKRSVPERTRSLSEQHQIKTAPTPRLNANHWTNRVRDAINNTLPEEIVQNFDGGKVRDFMRSFMKDVTVESTKHLPTDFIVSVMNFMEPHRDQIGDILQKVNGYLDGNAGSSRNVFHNEL